MRLPRTVFILGLATILPLSAGLLKTARADSTCTFNASDVSDIKANSQGIADELAARKALLTRIISCAKADARSLEDKLNNASVSENVAVIKPQLVDRLNDAINYYNIELEKVDGVGIAGTQAIAKEVLSWRKANYDVLAGQVANFIIWAQNQNLFSLARTRVDQLGRAVAFIEEAAAQNDLRSAFGAAQSTFYSADEKNTAARNAIVQFLPPDESLSLIQESLQSLSDAYQKFLDVSDKIQNLLSVK